jgi:hypothetical protein
MLWLVTAAVIIGGVRLLPRHGVAWFLLAVGLLIGLPLAIILTTPLLRSHGQRVLIEPASQTVYFERVRLAKGLRLPRFLPTFLCRFADLEHVEILRGRWGGPDWLVIATHHGRIYLASFHGDLSLLLRELTSLAQSSRPPITQSGKLPAIVACLIVFGALIIGFAMGWLP